MDPRFFTLQYPGLNNRDFFRSPLPLQTTWQTGVICYELTGYCAASNRNPYIPDIKTKREFYYL